METETCDDLGHDYFSHANVVNRASGLNRPLLRGMGFSLHSPESNLALWFNSSLNDLETAMLIERYIIGDKGFQIARETLLISPLENRG